jgi:hypothetical protein
LVLLFGFLLFLPVFLQTQEEAEIELPELSRGSIPLELLRPIRSESLLYPVDIVIGELGSGKASEAAYSFARLSASALLSGNAEHRDLASLDRVLRESYLAALDEINAQSYRIGNGREEPDGAVSFLVRFIGRELSVTGELFIRFEVIQQEVKVEEDAEIQEEQVIQYRSVQKWIFEELILEEAKSRDKENKEALHRLNFSPYERFF